MRPDKVKSGCLYVVATPIGNLADMTARAIEVLSACNLVAAEDTRHSAHLLQHFGIQTPTASFHDFSSRGRLERLLEQLEAGADIAIISDAGTPTIADPGFELVSAARQRDIKVVPIPGASSLLAALSVAGLPTDRFVFLGFLPAKAAAKAKLLQGLIFEERTTVVFESPHRILDSLQEMAGILGGTRRLFVGRELTKKFETTYVASIEQCLLRMKSDPLEQKGEFVLVLAGCEADQSQTAKIEQGLQILDLLIGEVSVKKAVSLAAKISGASRNVLYAAALERQPAK
ncbi:MAG: 16S rRNA (cytidine(1402)-2'-O)-methyltransferase [Pseudohongiellaceae bacterium]